MSLPSTLGGSGVFEGFAALLRLNVIMFKVNYAWMRIWIYLLTLIVRPTAQVVFFAIMARSISGEADVSFQVVGNSLQACVLVSLFVVAEMLTTQRRYGIVALTCLAPRSRLFAFAGQVWLVALHGVMIAAAAFGLSFILFDLGSDSADWFWLAMSYIVAVVATSGLGTALGSLGLYLPDINLIGNIVSGLMLSVCGVNFAVESLPKFLQVIAYCLPVTRSATAARLALHGGGPRVGVLLLEELALGAIWFALGYFIYLWSENQARRHATLELF